MVSVISKDSLLWNFLIQKDIIQVFVFPEFTGNPCPNGIMLVVVGEDMAPSLPDSHLLHDFPGGAALGCHSCTDKGMGRIHGHTGLEAQSSDKVWEWEEAPNTTMLRPCTTSLGCSLYLDARLYPGVDTEDTAGRIDCGR